MSTTVFEKTGSLLTVKPRGRLDTATSPALQKELQPYLNGVQEIVMDFTNLDYISSSGLRVLLAIEQQMESQGGSMRLTHVNAYITEVFELVGFTDMVTVERD